MKAEEDYNRLGREKSPYLLQHRSNPVCWYPWGKEAFSAARRENKPIFLSVGYSTCYWCHVMEKDSFEHQEVAEVLNKYFISIKVDREERPDVDSIYMDAVVGFTGQGGWPMSIFLTPDLEPFWGGTFIRRSQFVALLEKIQEAWSVDREKIKDSAREITSRLQLRPDREQESAKIDQSLLLSAAGFYQGDFDSKFGGFGSAPKFPPSMQVSLLLRIFRRSRHQEYLKMATETLRQMARGGIYDHLGGGFHRYSTDPKWFIPHFEKMLYDNALLSFTYLEAYQATGDHTFSAVAEDILDYILAEMTAPQGGFYSAQDAGEVHREGEYFTWTIEQLTEALNQEQINRLKEVYSLSEQGNFENGRNILALKPGKGWSDKNGSDLQEIHQQLLRHRSKRPAPHLDDKILTGWNGLAISAMAKGFQVLGEKRFVRAAEKSAEFIKSRLFTGDNLKRRFRDEDSAIDAFLQDYAYLIEGLLHLFEVTANKECLLFARKLQNLQDQKFWDKEKGGYFSSTAAEIIVRKKDIVDSALPAGNSVALFNLLRLDSIFPEAKYDCRAERLISFLSKGVQQYPTAFPRLLQALDYYWDHSKEVVVVSPNGNLEDDFRKFLSDNFLPNQVLLVGKEDEDLPLFQDRLLLEGKTTYYICQDRSCKIPTNDVGKAQEMILEDKPL